MIRVSLVIFYLFLVFGSNTAGAADEPFRPEAGKFPPLEKAHAYRGELVFVDHANRVVASVCRGRACFFAMTRTRLLASLRGRTLSRCPRRSARYSACTVLHVRAFLPPDPKISAVPVLPIDNKSKDANHNRGAGVMPAENHVLLSKMNQSLPERRHGLEA